MNESDNFEIYLAELLRVPEDGIFLLTSLLLISPRVSVCQCAKFDQFLPARSHFDSKRPENFVRIAKFPYAAFGPLFAFHCPLFFLRETMIYNANRHASPQSIAALWQINN